MGDDIRVLHVDDDAEFAALSSKMLPRAADIEVETAGSGERALEIIEEGSIDCVVSDYDMPGMDGVELLRTVRESHPGLPFVLFTGKGDEGVASEAVSAGVDEYTRKTGDPEQFDVLANRIERTVARQQAERTYREIFEKATVGMTVRDIDTGEVVDVNRAYCDLLGYDRDEAMELTLADVSAGVDGYTAERARERFQRVREEGTQSFEWLDETKGGEHVWVQVDLKQAEIEGTDRVLASVQDIDDRKQRERELERQNERLEELASVLGHDLRSPLQVARGNVDLARETGDVSYLDDVVAALDRMDRLLEDVLALARLSSAVEETSRVSIDTVARSCWTTAETGDADLVVEDDRTLHADETRLEQALVNLFRNAAEHGGDDVTVRVGTHDDGFFVADDGPGIPAPEREAVFEPGYSDGGSSGLGLAIVADVAEAHGWSVELLESESGGARFEFEL